MDFYAWREKDLNRLKKINIIFGLMILLIISFIVFVVLYTFWSIRLEEYCRKKAHNIVGDKWDILLDPNPSEYGYVQPDGDKITLGFREQLKCERSTPIFYSLD